jgi:phosphoribosyl 1,2-cyclic phosphodiesterase
LKIQFWGTRGSIPTPSTACFVTTKYGGDTTCISIESEDTLVIIDGGSGLRLLGLHLAHQKKPVKATFFFSHVHWDHIQGFPFFIPAFRQGNEFDLYGPRLVPTHGFVSGILEKALRGQQEDLNFPVQLKDMPAAMRFHDLDERATVEIKGKTGTLRISSFPLNHPGGCFGYRMEEHLPGQPVKVFAFATDTEHLVDLNPNVQSLIKNADLVLYDAQYTHDEYHGKNNGMPRHGWGHSTWEWGLKEGKAAGIKHLLLHHHDPLHDDAAVDAIEAAAQAEGAKHGIQVTAAAQGSEYVI